MGEEDQKQPKVGLEEEKEEKVVKEVKGDELAVEDEPAMDKQPTLDEKPDSELETDKPKEAKVTATATDNTKKRSRDEDDDEEPAEIRDRKKSPKVEAKPAATAPTPVFGSGFAFGGSFGSASSAPKTDVFAEAKPAAKDKPEAGSVFGSGFAFGSSLSNANGAKKNVFDEAKPKSAEENPEAEDKPAEEESGKDDYVQLKEPLEAKTIETGEESDTSVFTCECALYALNLNEADKGWRERGKGTLHVNTNSNSNTARLVMRRRGVLTVILNVPLMPTSAAMEGMKSSLSSEKYVRVSTIEDGNPHQFAMRVGTKETATGLYTKLAEAIESTKPTDTANQS